MSVLRARIRSDVREARRQTRLKLSVPHPSGQNRAMRRGHFRSSDEAFMDLVDGMRRRADERQEWWKR